MMAKKPKRTFRAEGLQIWAESIKTKVPGGTRISIGFPIAQVNENIEHPEKIARAIAKMLTASPMFR